MLGIGAARPGVDDSKVNVSAAREVSDEILASNSQSVGFEQQSQIGNGSKKNEDDGNASNNEVAKKDVDVEKNDMVATNDEDNVKSEKMNKGGFNEGLANSVVNEIECGLGNIKGNVEGLEQLACPRNEASDKIQNMKGHVCMFVRSISGPNHVRSNINLQVVLNGNQFGEIANGPIVEASNLSDYVAHS
ncbi:hypothetical protein LOK49_LG13G00702 [Camellia lanceoleosa]|uniref:Uncharacterized protein n=1 Tax=Camellia lanceoleosa TaxID=1840588 RepID=A0ACC0FHH7_9ERIC|nr:hypothetical protein LOK49_LG13G00702 [Camellia lanceoleosa]